MPVVGTQRNRSCTIRVRRVSNGRRNAGDDLTLHPALTYKLARLVFWEAGEIPARPRHCKCRGFEQFATGVILREGSSHLLTHESGDRPDAAIGSVDLEGRVDGRPGVVCFFQYLFHYHRLRHAALAV